MSKKAEEQNSVMIYIDNNICNLNTKWQSNTYDKININTNRGALFL